MSTFRDLKTLCSIITNSIDAIERVYQAKGLDFPSLDSTFHISDASEELRTVQEVLREINTASSAAFQLAYALRPPFLAMSDAANAHHLSACLRVAEKANVVEILRENGRDGCHIKKVSTVCGIEESKLGRILRTLATHHIFREVEPDIFSNNRISSCFDTGKSIEELHARPNDKYVGTSGAAAYVGTFTDEVCKASSHLLENLTDSAKGHGFSPKEAALQTAFSTNLTYFEWLEQQENRERFARYGACIRATSLWDPPHAILQGYDWNSLDSKSTIVDVGGGTGIPSMEIARANQQIKIIIQDRGAVVEQGIQYWKANFPEALQSGQVSFNVHDFFHPQPNQNVSVFLLRTICHDWPDSIVIVILRHLRNAAVRHTTLIVGDHIMPFACENDEASIALPGVDIISPPAPLLGNLGRANANAYYIDMTMQVLLNGQERTLKHLINLLSRAGWEAIRVRMVPCSAFGYVEATPIFASDS